MAVKKKTVKKASNPKSLQKMQESAVTPLEWSTISNVHGGGPKAIDDSELLKKMQTLSASANPVPLDWSTISNVHGGGPK
ncbi:MAG: hypothetical protein RIB78_03265 [Gammaproteobacteria bacterium]